MWFYVRGREHQESVMVYLEDVESTEFWISFYIVSRWTRRVLSRRV